MPGYVTILVLKTLPFSLVSQGNNILFKEKLFENNVVLPLSLGNFSGHVTRNPVYIKTCTMYENKCDHSLII